MRACSRNTNHSLAGWVIVSCLVLRSFIAPGFMLDTSGGGLAIIFCEGPAGAYAAAQQDTHHGHHGQHGDEADSQNHFSPSCTHWSTSGLLVINTFFEAVVLPPADISSTYYQSPFIKQYSYSLRFSRGPPLVRTS